MKEDKAYKILKKVGAIKEGHFVFRNGHHGDQYIEMQELFKNTEQLAGLLEVLAKRIYSYNAVSPIDVIMGPAEGGNILATALAPHLSLLRGTNVRAIKTRKENGSFEVSDPNAHYIAKSRVLIIEDVITTGASVQKVIDLVRRNKGFVSGIAVLWNRSAISHSMFQDVPRSYTLINKQLTLFHEQSCPLCRTMVPINTEYGAGKEFLASRRK